MNPREIVKYSYSRALNLVYKFFCLITFKESTKAVSLYGLLEPEVSSIHDNRQIKYVKYLAWKRRVTALKSYEKRFSFWSALSFLYVSVKYGLSSITKSVENCLKLIENTR